MITRFSLKYIFPSLKKFSTSFEELWPHDIKTPLRKFDYERDIVLYKKFKKAIKEKNAIEATFCLEQVKKNRVIPSPFLYRFLIGVLASHGLAKKCFSYYNEMLKHGFEVNGITYSCLFSAFSRSKNSQFALKAASHVYSDVVTKCPKLLKEDDVIRQSYIWCLIKHKEVDMALSLCDQIQKEDKKSLNQVFFSNLMSLYRDCPHSALIYTLNLMRMMEVSKVAPDNYIIHYFLRSILKYQKVQSDSLPTAHSLVDPSFSATCLEGKLDTVEGRLQFVGGEDNILALMKKHGMTPNIIILSDLVEIARFSSKVNVPRIWRMMKEHQITPDIKFFIKYSLYLVSKKENKRNSLNICLKLMKDYKVAPNSAFFVAFAKLCYDFSTFKILCAIMNKHCVPIDHIVLTGFMCGTPDLETSKAVVNLMIFNNFYCNEYMINSFERCFDKLKQLNMDKTAVDEMVTTFKEYSKKNKVLDEEVKFNNLFYNKYDD